MEAWITQLEAAELRNVGLQVINNWARRGHVRTKEKYGKVLVSRSDVLAYKPSKPGPKPKTPKQAGKKSVKK